MKTTLATTSIAALLATGLFVAAPAAAQNGALAAFTGTANFMPALGFSDISAQHTYYAPIRWMAAERITHGYADGTFKSTRHITRGETASFLYRYLDPEHTTPDTSPFPDVGASSSHYQAITWMHAEKMATGYADKTFRPRQSITRGEAAIVLYGMDEDHKKPHGFRPFKDVAFPMASYAAVQWLRLEGLAQGYGNGQLFRPHQPITRAELAKLIYLYEQNVAL
jgi:hypothetical protein